MKIDSTYVHLGDGGAATPIPVTDSFWSDLTSGRMPEAEDGRLVMQLEAAEEWDSWEMHPEGEELVLLMSGSVDFILDRDGKESAIELRAPGSFVLVPRGTWHRARPRAPSSLLFITPGRGTQHRPVAAAPR